MTREPEDRLRGALQRPVSPVLHEALLKVIDATEPALTRNVARKVGRRGMAVIAAITLSGLVVAAAAVPAVLGVLFPPPVAASFTFASGVVCSVDVKVAPDFTATAHPEAAVAHAQDFLESLDISALPIEEALRAGSPGSAASAAAAAAREAAAHSGAGSPSAERPFAAESDAVASTVVAAVFDELARNGLSGVSLETSETTCD